MLGLITEKDWEQINQTFPGIRAFYEKIGGRKPKTFLELQWLFLNQKRFSAAEGSVEKASAVLLRKES